MKHVRMSLKSDGTLQGQFVEPTNKLLLDDLTAPISASEWKILATPTNLLTPDVTDYVESDYRLGNTYVVGWVYLTTTKYYPTIFEYTRENNIYGFQRSIPAPTGGWRKGWNRIFFKADGYSNPGLTPWNDMVRLQLYRSGETTVVDSGEYIRFKDVRLHKVATGRSIYPASLGDTLSSVVFSEVGDVEALLAWYPLIGDLRDKTSIGVGTSPSPTFNDDGIVLTGRNYVSTDRLPIQSDRFAFSFWVVCYDNGDFATMLSQGYIGGTYLGFTLAADWRTDPAFPDRYASLQWRTPESGYTTDFPNFFAGKSGVAIHVVLSYQDGVATAYRDGVLFGSKTHPAPGLVGDVFTVGGREDDTKQMVGRIRDLRVYDRTLTGSDARLLYNVTTKSKRDIVMAKDRLYVRGSLNET